MLDDVIYTVDTDPEVNPTYIKDVFEFVKSDQFPEGYFDHIHLPMCDCCIIPQLKEEDVIPFYQNVSKLLKEKGLLTISGFKMLKYPMSIESFNEI
jgi:spermidine synthase